MPYLTGERCPYPDPCARGGWIGLTSRSTRPMMIRSLLEGVTFGMRDALEIMQQMDIPIIQVRASGGGARSDFWQQLQADIYNHPVVLTNAAATVVEELLPGKIDRVVLGHLSRDCNTPELALQTVRGALTKLGKIDTELFCASQSDVSPLFRVGETDVAAFQSTFENAFFPAA